MARVRISTTVPYELHKAALSKQIKMSYALAIGLNHLLGRQNLLNTNAETTEKVAKLSGKLSEISQQKYAMEERLKEIEEKLAFMKRQK